MGLGARPLVVIEGRTGLLGQPMAAALAAARRDGWEIVRGWGEPRGLSAAHEPSIRRRLVCSGPVRTPDDAQRALAAAASGAGLVVAASAARLTIDRLLEDLRRLGPVEHRPETPPPGISESQRALLGLVAEGLSIPEAAAALRLRPGVAGRRIAQATRSLGVESTAQALVSVLASRAR